MSLMVSMRAPITNPGTARERKWLRPDVLKENNQQRHGLASPNQNRLSHPHQHIHHQYCTQDTDRYRALHAFK